MAHAALSLRGVITFLSAASVAVVATITLSLALTTSLEALRSAGKNHALALLTTANTKTVMLFEEPQTAVDALRNITMRTNWSFPSDDPSVFRMYEILHETLFLERLASSAGILTYFADNTRISRSPAATRDFYGGTNFIPSPLSQSPNGLQGQTMRAERKMYFSVNHTLAPDDLPEIGFVIRNATKTVNSAFWNTTLLFATGSGTRTVMGTPIVLAENGKVHEYVGVVAPLYRLGDPVGRNSVYGFGIATLYTDWIADFLADTRATPNTASFAISGNYVISSSLTHLPPSVVTPLVTGAVVPLGCSSTADAGDLSRGQQFLVCRKRTKEYGSPALQAAAKDAAFMSTEGTAVKLISSSDGILYAASARVAMRFPGLKIQLVLLMPEADIIGDVVKARNAAIIVTCAVFVVVAVLTFVLISRLLHPLTTVAARMQRAASLEDDGDDRELSAMTEVADLQAAYYALNDELQRIRSFVPQSVFVGHEDEDDASVQLESTTEVRHSDSDTISNRSTRSSKHSSRQSKKANNQQRTTAAATMAIDHGDTERTGGHGSGSNGSGMASFLNVNCSVSAASVSVMIINACDFTAAAIDAPRDQLIARMASYVDVVYTTVHKEGGVLNTFHGDHFAATFNAVRPCSSHARHCCVAALEIIKSAATTGFGLPLRGGIATGRSIVGNVGSRSAKAFATIGAPYRQATLLERLTRLYQCRLLATKRTCEEVATVVTHRLVDILPMPGSRRPVPIGAVLGLVKDLPSANPGTAGFSGSEWLYVVANGDGDLNSVHNNAFLELYDGRLESSRALLTRREELFAEQTAAGTEPTTLSLSGAGIADRLEVLLAKAEALRQLAAATETSTRQPRICSDLGEFYTRCFPSGATRHHSAVA
jgi:class 3 adenylate cyclase